MCDHCGCNEPTHSHSHDHPHDHGHSHAPEVVDVRASALALNQRLADQNRGWLRAKGIRAFNLLSSPGSGKTALLEAVLRALPHSAAIVGDLQTDNDARRLRSSGAQALQINTGGGCHLDAHAVAHALDALDCGTGPDALRYLFIENVGNLVCPASFDLGEERRITLLSVTEGEDKPLKYPAAFATAHAVVLTKTDLLPALSYDLDAALSNIRRMAPDAALFQLSSRLPDTLAPFLAWLQS
ncbi:MAG: hydrogenase nickel incorporation protein HypB [Kiritimatiellae bacterium]|nr:hydrogenase nickel incorporation protein HypB [Kiritimatiellia bacterium]